MKKHLLTCCLLLTVLPLAAQRRWEAGLTFSQLVTPAQELWGNAYTPQLSHSLGLRGGYLLGEGVQVLAGLNLTRRNVMRPAFFCATPPMMRTQVWQVGTEVAVRKTFLQPRRLQPYATAGLQAYVYGWDAMNIETDALVSLAPPVDGVMLATFAAGGVRLKLGQRLSLDLDAGAQYGVNPSLSARHLSMQASTAAVCSF